VPTALLPRTAKRFYAHHAKRQYQEYYAAIERIVTESEASTYYEELALLNEASQLKPRVLVCAPSNAAVDNLVVKIMSDRFVDGSGAKYSPSIVRVGAGIVNDAAKKVSLQGAVDAVIEQGADSLKLDSLVETGRKELKRLLNEIKKLRVRIQALVDACPYEISEDWEIRILEEADDKFKVLFVNHKVSKVSFGTSLPFLPSYCLHCILQLVENYNI
jgi:senataxin